MRVNSYNKFFAKVAKIMNTEVKSVKPIDGRYKVELSNHVYLNVYRGVSGSLFIHDHRGIAHITSCYDFDDFKTMKDLYERLISDYSESTNAETVTQTSEETNKTEYCESTNNDIKGHIYVDTDSVKVAPLPERQTSEESIKDTIMTDDCIKTVLNMEELFSQMFGNTIRSKCKMYNNSCYGCPADRQGNRCGGKQWCKQTWKRYGAIVNPEWHHVSLATLANIDFDMLDEKRKLVFDINQILKDGIRNLYKCENHISFEVLERYVIRKCDALIRHNRLKAFWFSYIARQLDDVRRNTIYLYTPYITAHRNRW
nr:MAG TPA: hypothetical protein [Caudoviricetes sp.]